MAQEHREEKRPETPDHAGAAGGGAERGREAGKPGEIPRKGWRDILKRTAAAVGRDHLSLVAAGVAFFLLLGLIPGLAALISLYALVADPAQVQEQFAAVSGMLPAEMVALLSEQMTRIAGDATAAGLGAVIGIGAALWGGKIAMKNLIKGLNITYKEEEKRGTIKVLGVSLLLTLVAVGFGIVAIALVAVLPAALAVIGLGEHAGLVANLIRWPLLVLLAVGVLAFIYRFAPCRSKPRWRWVSWGSVIATFLWVLASALFSFYVSNFGAFNQTYGSLGAVVVLMLWLYISSFVALLGAELNAEMEHQTARDTTVAPEQEMGQRGARVADKLGEAYT